MQYSSELNFINIQRGYMIFTFVGQNKALVIDQLVSILLILSPVNVTFDFALLINFHISLNFDHLKTARLPLLLCKIFITTPKQSHGLTLVKTSFLLHEEKIITD